MGLILLAIIIIIVLVSYSSYVSLISRKNKVREALSSIDVQLKKRYDLIPNILTIAKKFMDHEKDLMTELTQLRTQVLSINSENEFRKKLKIDDEIKNKMQQLFVQVENYPQLKSDSTMVAAIQTYNEVEEHIAAARRFFNTAVNNLNNAVEIFPSSIFAKMLDIDTKEYFEVSKEETKSINAKDFF